MEHPTTHLVRPFHIVAEMARIDLHKFNRRVIFDFFVLDCNGDIRFQLDDYHKRDEIYLHQTKTGRFLWHSLRQRRDTYRSWQMLPSDEVYVGTKLTSDEIEFYITNPIKVPRDFIHTMEDDDEFESTVCAFLSKVPILAIPEIQQIVFSFM